MNCLEKLSTLMAQVVYPSFYVVYTLHSRKKTRNLWPPKKFVKNSWSNFDLQTLSNCDDMRPRMNMSLLRNFYPTYGAKTP